MLRTLALIKALLILLSVIQADFLQTLLQGIKIKVLSLVFGFQQQKNGVQMLRKAYETSVSILLVLGFRLLKNPLLIGKLCFMAINKN